MLSYYLGQKGKIQGEGLRFMRITSFPRFLVLVFKRFYSNDYTIEKDTSQVIYSGNLEIEGQKYRLISQICHQGKHETGSYKCSVLMGEKWFEAEDLLINEVLKKQMLLGEPYIQMYEKIN
jgi:ubiquitin C-terminal hydrolase